MEDRLMSPNLHKPRDLRGYSAVVVGFEETHNEIENKNYLERLGARDIKFLTMFDGYVCYVNDSMINELRSNDKIKYIRDASTPSSVQCT